MPSLVKLLGKGLLKNEKSSKGSKASRERISIKSMKERTSIEKFLKSILGTHLIKKSSNSK